MHLSGLKEASSPGPKADYWVLAQPGSDGHARLTIATGSWAVLSLALIQNAAAPANRELKPVRAASQLTAFMRRNGKSHGAAACALQMPCSSNSPGALLALPTDPQLPWALCMPLTRASGLSSLPSWNQPLGQLSPPTPPSLQDLGTRVLLPRANPTCGIFTYLLKAGGWGEAKQVVHLKPKNLTSSWERVLLLGPALRCQGQE